jgi:hypothetical protein
MKMLLAKLAGVYYYLFGVAWIVSPIGEDCSPVPIYIVVEDGK